MAYRLPSERVPLALNGPSVEVERIASWAIRQYAAALATAFYAADGPAAEYSALEKMYGLFMVEAQPTWDIVDHRGPVPVTPAGMMRLPLPLAFEVYEQWSATFEGIAEEKPATAVDALVAPGALRDELNARLRAVA